MYYYVRNVLVLRKYTLTRGKGSDVSNLSPNDSENRFKIHIIFAEKL